MQLRSKSPLKSTNSIDVCGLNIWVHNARSAGSAGCAGECIAPKDPNGYVQKNATKRLAAIRKLAFDVIPQDPTRAEYRQGNTLGEENKHWFQAKFFQQYRLFFRYHAPSKILVLAGVNDADTKRAYESDDDAYRVFGKMLSSGHPPNDFDQLLAAASRQSGRLNSLDL